MKKLLIIITILISIFSSILLASDLNSILKEYEEIEKIDISDIIDKKISKNQYDINPLANEIKEIYSKDIYNHYILDINDTNNIFFKTNLTKTEKLMKKDFQNILKKYMQTTHLFTIYDNTLSSENDFFGILMSYKMTNFFEFLEGYIYYLKNNGEVEFSNKILNRLTIDLNNTMYQSNLIDFTLSLVLYDILHTNNLCSYSNSDLFKISNSNALKNVLYDKLYSDMVTTSRLLKTETFNKMMNDKFTNKMYLHTIKMDKYYIKQLIAIYKSNDLLKLDEFENKINNDMPIPNKETFNKIKKSSKFESKQYIIYITSKVMTYVHVLKLIKNYKKLLEKIDKNINKFAICSQ